MKKQVMYSENTKEALVYPLLFVLLLWMIWFAQEMKMFDLESFGLLPRSSSGLVGILTMPLLHSTTDIHHIINNSLPAYCLLAGLIYFYKPIALKVFLFVWIFTGILLWVIAENVGAKHIGFSGVIYALVSFLFVSGMLRKFPHLQVISMLVVFLYGSLIWGIFPTEKSVSWEGHLSGLLVGITFAYLYRKQGPKRSLYTYEIEKQNGIEPPDLEGIYNARLAQLEAIQNQQNELHNQTTNQNTQDIVQKQTYFVYTYVSKNQN